MRVADLAGVLSMIADAAMGMPPERGLRTGLIATTLARHGGVDAAGCADAFYVGLLKYAGCTAESETIAAVTGDEIAFGQYVYGIDLWSARESLPAVVRAATHGRRGVKAARATMQMLSRLPRLLDTIHVHCEVARTLAAELGLPPRTQQLLEQAFERWDGKGVPGKQRKTQVPLALRYVHVASEIEAGHRVGGLEGARALVEKRARRAIDPEIAAVFARHAAAVCGVLEAPSMWAAVLAAEPAPHLEATDEIVRAALRAMGQVADMKSSYRRHHSGAVATLARDAARAQGLAPSAIDLVEQAGFVHDIGCVVVSTLVWDKPGPLTDPERERIRMHAYLGERLLARAERLAPVAQIAIAAHERLDGSGYHRHSNAGALSAEARILAAADVYRALVEPRPYRPALTPRDAAARIDDAVRAGQLCGAAAAAVLSAAGQPSRCLEVTSSLTAREHEVLTLLVRGLTNKEIASELGVAASTAGHHVERIFTKLEVKTRAGAAVVALQRGLVRP